MGNVSSELEMDPQHGPIIRVTVDGTRVAVYLAQETGVVTPQTGRDQYGIEVKGPWWKYRQVTALPDEVVDLGVLLECREENERLRAEVERLREVLGEVVKRLVPLTPVILAAMQAKREGE